MWFTGNSYPAPMTPYEAALKGFLDNGGRLFVSGQDLLDQAAGTTPFVHDYLHITWDGTETQNDKATNSVHEVAGNAVTAGVGTVPLDHSVLGGAAFEDQITPNGTATAIFDDDSAAHDAPVVQRHVQGRVPRVPARGLRDRGAEGRPDPQDVHVLRLVPREEHGKSNGRAASGRPFRLSARVRERGLRGMLFA